MLHGMDIDLDSKIQGLNFAPSNMDLLQIKRSFVSAVSFSVKKENKKEYVATKINCASIGLFSHLSPAIEISNTVVPPQTYVSKDLIQSIPDTRCPDQRSTMKVFKQEFVSAICYIIFIIGVCMHLIPPYILWVDVFAVGDSIWVAVFALPTALVVQTVSYFAFVMILQSIALFGSHQSNKPWNNEVYAVYATAVYSGQTLSILFTAILGTPAYNVFLRMLGVTFEGRAIIFEAKMYEHKFLMFEDRTLVEQSPGIVGHYGLYDAITIGPCKVSGIIHEGTFAANTVVTSKESGPWRAYIGTYNKEREDKKDIKQVLDYSTTKLDGMSSDSSGLPLNTMHDDLFAGNSSVHVLEDEDLV